MSYINNSMSKTFYLNCHKKNILTNYENNIDMNKVNDNILFAETDSPHTINFLQINLI